MDTTYDIIIVGTGASGLFAALQLPSTKHILLITKEELKHSNSYLAQGGICVLLNPNDYSSYFEDTMHAGRYENRRESVHIMIEESPHIIQDLIHLGVSFDEDSNGDFNYTKEGAHSTSRILHHKDITGKEIVRNLLTKVKQKSNITLQPYTTMLDLIHTNNHCQGIIVKTKNGNIQPIFASSVILATGGVGGLFYTSTNYPHITGDSLSIALRNHITLENIHYIQLHPTVLYSKKMGRRFLISESVRGEGAILQNRNMQRFVNELLPRDVVTTAILSEMKKEQSPYVYLSLSSMTEEQIKRRFPSIYTHCQNEGYRLGRDLIPITPAQHYLMGGIHTDINGVTSMKHLYAIGETACNGVHGANRLASNSLLESLVFAKRATRHMLTQSVIKPIPYPIDLKDYQDYDTYMKENKHLLLLELKRKDEHFYDQWCNNET